MLLNHQMNGDKSAVFIYGVDYLKCVPLVLIRLSI